jgi:pimeloyl-ACP methyl ester carboxylesterase
MASDRSHRPVRLTALLYGIAAGVVILGILLAVLPIDWRGARTRFDLWRAGARPVIWEKHRGLTVDRCRGAAPIGCECVWLIHGLGDTLLTWRKVLSEPAPFGDRPVRLFAIDLPGHGGSLRRQDADEYRVSAMAKEIDRGIAATEECQRNWLVGNSLGGWIAATIAASDSEWHAKGESRRYERLILLSPAGTKRAEEETKGLFGDGSVESLKEFQRRAYFKPREYPDAFWQEAARRMGGSAADDVRKAQTDEDRLDDRLGKITTPTTIVWGSADRVLPKPVMDGFVSGIPKAKLVTLPECGHLPQKECPEKLFQAWR